MFSKVDENFNYAQTLEKLIKIDKLSENIIYLDQEVKKFQKSLNSIRDVQRMMLEGKVQQASKYYYSFDPSNHGTCDSILLFKLNRKDIVLQLEKDHMETKVKLIDKQKLLESLLNIFVKQFKYDDYSYLGPSFVSMIDIHVCKMNEDMDVDS